MKKWFFLFVALILIISCQDDDVCVENTTPKLVIVIKDDTTLEKKTLDTLWVEYYNSYSEIDTLKYYQIDSLQVPLRIDDGPIGLGLITSLVSEKDSISMSYTPENQFVSKACGYKKIFNNYDFDFVYTHNLLGLQVNSNTISNSNETHLFLYY